MKRQLAGFVALLFLTVSADAATVASLIVAQKGQSLSILNTQASVVSGTLRLIPSSAVNPLSPLTFTLPAGAGPKEYVDVLSQFGSNAAYGVVMVESSDVVKTNLPALRLAHQNRLQQYSFSFNAGMPNVGTLYLALLSAEVKVNLYAKQGDVVPLSTHTYASADERVVAIPYTDLALQGLSVWGGILEVAPVTGQAAAYLVNAPMRMRAVRVTGYTPPLSVAGGVACEFASGYSAVTTAADSTTYQWSVFNANVSGSAAMNSVNFALGTKGYATVALRSSTDDRGYGFNEFNLRIDGKLVVSNLLANDATAGKPVPITWDPLPGSGFLSGTDFPSQGTSVSLTGGSYSYTAGVAGPKSVTLSPDAVCGSQPQTVSYTVVPACTAPSATVSAPSSAVSGSTFIASMPAGAASYVWSATNGTIQSGQGTRTATILVTGAAGSTVTVHGTASNGAGCTATDTASVAVTQPAPVIVSFTADSYTVPAFGTTTLRFSIQNAASWKLLSSLGNGRTPSNGTGSGSFTSQYGRNVAAGADTVTLQVTGLDGSVISQTLPQPIN